jgi:hypothetical protein
MDSRYLTSLLPAALILTFAQMLTDMLTTCAQVWRPPLEFVNGTSISRWNSNRAGTTWQAVTDLQAMRDFAWPLPEVDLIAWASSQVNQE